MDAQSLTDKISRFVAENFMVDFGKGVDHDTDLFDAKYLDSFGFVDLVAWIEQSFSVKLAEDDLADPAMGSINGMQALVSRRLAEQQGST